MRRSVTVVVSVVMVACSSTAVAPAEVDSGHAGTGNPFLDASADTSMADAVSIDSAAPDVADADDSDVSDAAETEDLGDATDASDGAADTSDATDAGGADAFDASETSDAGADAGSVEEQRCRAGAPRLTWGYDAGGLGVCYDSTMSTAVGYAVFCTFRGAWDGVTRCLPALGGDVVGFVTSNCTAYEWTRCGYWPAGSSGKAGSSPLVSVNETDGVHVRRGMIYPISAGQRLYAKNILDVCGLGSGLPPVCDSGANLGLAASVDPANEIAPSKFVAATF